MRRLLAHALIAVLLAIGFAAWVGAQGQRASPHEKTEAAVDGAKISIEYGRPYMKGRKIFGGLVPYGQVWRTGADEATTVATDKPLVLGNVTVPAGTYTLYTIPGEKEWTLIINKQTGQWGTQYSESQDLGRLPLKVSRLDSPAEQFTITVAPVAGGGEIHFDWESTRATAPFTVKK